MARKHPFETRLPPAACPYCEHILDAAGHPSNPTSPRPGDVTICFYCAQILIFDQNITPCKPAAGQLEHLFAAYPEEAEKFLLMQQFIRELDRRSF